MRDSSQSRVAAPAHALPLGLPYKTAPPWCWYCALARVAGVAVWPLLVLLAVVAAHLGRDVPIPTMTRDIAALSGLHPLTGMLSSVGVLLWAASAAIWFFAALVHRHQGRRPAARFALSGAALSSYLCLDDMFLIHEHLAPTYLGVPELAVHALIASCTLAYLVAFRRRLWRPDAGWLLLALTMLAASMAVDAVLEPWLWRLRDWIFLLEDGLKWFGIVFWLTFCIARCRRECVAAR